MEEKLFILAFSWGGVSSDVYAVWAQDEKTAEKKLLQDYKDDHNGHPPEKETYDIYSAEVIDNQGVTYLFTS